MAPWCSSLGPHSWGASIIQVFRQWKWSCDWLLSVLLPAFATPSSTLETSLTWQGNGFTASSQVKHSKYQGRKTLQFSTIPTYGKISMFIKLGLETGRISSSNIKIVGQMITFGVYFMPLHFSRSKLRATTFLWENNSKSKIHCQCFIDHKMWKYLFIKKTLSCDAWYSRC